ncbi:spermatid-associated protein [Pteropus alecto]|uniref:spermatid-associated protein n=1 Tax=Pteropus alecto TaxID=9402 RepID=UPI0003F12591|nr:spermatid-associated protein [Pteropus alecto]
MSPLECSECFGDQLLHRTYTWHLTLHSRPHFTRKKDTRSESLDIPINVVLPQNRFSSVPLDPMERPTSQADLELDYNPPRVQLSDEMFVFQDGRWVNENCRLQSPHFSPSSSFHHKLHHKRLAKEHLLQEENKSLRDENRALRDENRALRKENKILQVLWEERWMLREMNQALQALRDENRLLQEENRALHALRQEHRLCQEDKALWENNKLRLQQKLVIDTVTEVTARMEMLIEELYAFMPAKNKDLKKPSRV